MTTRTPRWLSSLIPDTQLARKLSLQSILFAIGEGLFLTGSAVFFTKIVGLTAFQVGVGITVGEAASFLVAVPLGKVADRIGPRRMWAIGAFGAAALYAVWPFVDGFTMFLAMMVALQIVETAGHSGRGAYTLDVFPREQRVQSLAYMRVALNVGFTVGALIGGVALALNNNDVIRAVPLFTAVVLALNALYITRLPDAEHDRAPAPMEGDELLNPGALRNRGFVSLMTLDGVLGTNQVLLNIVIPLWLVEATDAPRVLLAFLFGTNTVMCIFLPMAAARGVKDVTTALRAIRVSSAFFVVSCLITLATHDTVGWVTIALVWLGHVTVTGAELYLSAASWTFEAELMDPRQRGAYQGAAGLSGTLGKVWAPAVYTFLAMNWGAAGWLVIAGIIAVATIGVHPSTRLARRFLEQHVPADVLADARASSPDPEDGIAVGPPSLINTDEPVPESTGGLIR
jgi:MFS family permease